MHPFNAETKGINDRDISSIHVQLVDMQGLITIATAMLVRGDYKLT
jgi:hypothetical protein